MEDIILIGYGGHAKSIADSIERKGDYKIIGYTDKVDCHSKYKYLGDDSVLETYWNMGVKNVAICVGYLGKNRIREKIYAQVKKIGFCLPVICDPTSIISQSAFIGEGVFIGKNVVINSEVIIGKMAIINTGALVEHECIIGDFVHIAVGTVVCGQVKIGKSAFVGANATIIQCMEISEKEIVPAGMIIR